MSNAIFNIICIRKYCFCCFRYVLFLLFILFYFNLYFIFIFLLFILFYSICTLYFYFYYLFYYIQSVLYISISTIYFILFYFFRLGLARLMRGEDNWTFLLSCLLSLKTFKRISRRSLNSIDSLSYRF